MGRQRRQLPAFFHQRVKILSKLKRVHISRLTLLIGVSASLAGAAYAQVGQSITSHGDWSAIRSTDQNTDIRERLRQKIEVDIEAAKFTEALDEIDRMRVMAPEYEDLCMRYLGEVYIRKGLTAKALQIERTLSESYKDAASYMRLGYLHCLQGNLVKSRQMFTMELLLPHGDESAEFKAFLPNTADSGSLLGAWAMEAGLEGQAHGNDRIARFYLEQARLHLPGNALICCELGCMEYRLKDYVAAKRDLESALARSDSPSLTRRAREKLGWIELRTKRLSTHAGFLPK
jgi:tetratricopeptide (TPR) repeat protein